MIRPREEGRTGVQLLPAEERRRSQRVIIRVPVKLHLASAHPPKGIPAHTIAVNDHGAMLLCDRTFDAESRFDLENARTGGRVACRVTRSPRQTPEGFLIPVEFAQPMPGFWGISFPPADWKPQND